MVTSIKDNKIYWLNWYNTNIVSEHPALFIISQTINESVAQKSYHLCQEKRVLQTENKTMQLKHVFDHLLFKALKEAVEIQLK